MPPNEELAAFAAHGTTMALFLSVRRPRELQADLIDGGYAEDTPCAVVYRRRGRTRSSSAARSRELGERVRAAKITTQALVLVGPALGDAARRPLARLRPRLRPPPPSAGPPGPLPEEGGALREPTFAPGAARTNGKLRSAGRRARARRRRRRRRRACCCATATPPADVEVTLPRRPTSVVASRSTAASATATRAIAAASSRTPATIPTAPTAPSSSADASRCAPQPGVELRGGDGVAHGDQARPRPRRRRPRDQPGARARNITADGRRGARPDRRRRRRRRSRSPAARRWRGRRSNAAPRPRRRHLDPRHHRHRPAVLDRRLARERRCRRSTSRHAQGSRTLVLTTGGAAERAAHAAAPDAARGVLHPGRRLHRLPRSSCAAALEFERCRVRRHDGQALQARPRA